MYPTLLELIHQAESQYLQPEEIENLKTETSTLKQRMNLYKSLRDQEINIFQDVANQLVEKYTEDKIPLIQSSIHQWITISRYCAMAMLLNNQEFLERRLLEWLTDIVEAHQASSISDSLHTLLLNKLRKLFAEKDLVYIKPFLAQANDYLSTSLVAVDNS